MLLMNEYGEFVDPDEEPRHMRLKPSNVGQIRADEVRRTARRRCATCGREIDGTRKYCSERCRVIARRERRGKC